MATVLISSTENLRVNLTNQYNDSKNINIPNPRSNLTLAGVREAFAPLLNNTFMAGTEYLTQVKNARIIRTNTSEIQ